MRSSKRPPKKSLRVCPISDMDIKILASGSGGNCYRLSDGVTDILLECGIPKHRIMAGIGYEVGRIGGVLITHEHGDHAKAARDMLYFGRDIYASRGTFDALGLSGYHCKAVAHGQLFTVGTFSVYPFDVQHDAAEPLGFVITSKKTGERLLFFTDTYYVKYVFKGVDIIMGEVNYSTKTMRDDLPESRKNRIFESHMSLEHFLELLDSYPQVKKIYLLHLSDDNSDAEMFRREVAKKTGAEVYVC